MTVIARLICEVFHGDRATCFPHHGMYECRACLRKWPVPWAEVGKRLDRHPGPEIQAQGAEVANG